LRILIDIEHPAHVHFFKNFAWQMREKGHQILISAFDKEVTLELLRAYNFEYDLCGKQGNSLFASAKQLLERDCRVYRLVRRFKSDVIIGIGDIVGAHASKVTKATSIVFTDTENAKLANILTFPFADVICTPSCFKKDLGEKQVRYNGYHELAYLHPNYFKPDPSVLKELGLTEGEKFVILRFVAWQAVHDVGQHGFDMLTKRRLVKEIEKYVRVFITSESPLPSEFEKYRITTPPEKVHDLLYYATLLIGDTQTMTTEAALLGTPAIRCNSFVGPNDMGNFVELEREYDLIYSFREPDKAIKKALELIQQPDLKEQWAKKRQRLLSDKIDVTKFMVDFIENYPQSFYRYKEESRKRL